MSDQFFSDREHAVLMSAMRRRGKRTKWVLIAMVSAAIICSAAIRWADEPDFQVRPADWVVALEHQPRIGHKLFRTSQGAVCSTALSAACVYPNGEVHIPSGPALATISAYFDLRTYIPGATTLSGWAFDPVDEAMTPIQTREVRGILSAADTLTGMIEGTVLTWREIPSANHSGAMSLWVIRERSRTEGAQKQ